MLNIADEIDLRSILEPFEPARIINFIYTRSDTTTPTSSFLEARRRSWPSASRSPITVHIAPSSIRPWAEPQVPTFPSTASSGSTRRGIQTSLSLRLKERTLSTTDLIPCSSEQVPEVLGTVMLFGILNRVVDTFVSKSEGGPMFPSPVRALMKFESISPMVQRMMSSMMSWLMHEEDAKVQAGQVLGEINKVAPIIKGYEGCTDEPPAELPQELTWAAENETIGTSFAFLAEEAEAMSTAFVPDAIRNYMKSWVSTWDGGKAPPGDRAQWLDPLVEASGKRLDLKDKAVVGMLKLMLVVVVASDKTDDNLISECQETHGIRGSHAAVMWAAFLAAQRMCQLAIAA